MARRFIKFTFFILSVAVIFQGCSSDEKKALNFLEEGKAYFEEGDFAKAKIQFKNAIKLMPQSIEANDLLSKSQLKLSEHNEAFQTFLRLEQLDPENLAYKLDIASFYLLGKKHIEAERIVNEVLKKEPDNIRALYLSWTFRALWL